MATRPGQSLWQALETVPGLCCTDGEWRRRLVADYAGASQYLRSAGKLATSYPCPSRPECGCIHRVVQHDTDRFVSVCDCEPPRCSRQKMARAELALVVVDTGALAAGVAECLEIEPHYEMVPGMRSAWGLGTYRPSPGIEVPAYLTAQLSDGSLESAVRGLGAFAGGPLVLVLPTRRLLCPTTVSLLQQVGGCVIALSDDVAIDEDGTIAAHRPIKSIWAPFLKLLSSTTRVGEGLRRRQERTGERAVALSEDAGRLLAALRKHVRKPWPGSVILCREAGKRHSGGRIAPMHRTVFAQAVRDLVDEGILDLKGKKSARKGDSWDLVNDPGAQISRKP